MRDGRLLVDLHLFLPLLQHEILGVQADLRWVHGPAADREGDDPQRRPHPNAHLRGRGEQVVVLLGAQRRRRSAGRAWRLAAPGSPEARSRSESAEECSSGPAVEPTMTCPTRPSAEDPRTSMSPECRRRPRSGRGTPTCPPPGGTRPRRPATWRQVGARLVQGLFAGLVGPRRRTRRPPWPATGPPNAGDRQSRPRRSSCNPERASSRPGPGRPGRPSLGGTRRRSS